MQQRRTKRGTFAAGNSGGPGNPHASQVAKLRSVMLSAVTATAMRSVVKKLIAMAEGGDIKAIELLLNRTLGKIDATFINATQDDASTNQSGLSAAEFAEQYRAARMRREAGLPMPADDRKDRLIAIAERVRAARQAVADQSNLNCPDPGRESVTLDVSQRATP